MNCPLMVVLIRAGTLDDSSAYAIGLREMLLGTTLAGSAVLGAKELLQPAEFREFNLGPDPVRDLSIINFDFLASSDRVLIIILDARPVPESEEQSDLTGALSFRLDWLRSPLRILEARLKNPGTLYNPNQEDRGLTRLGLADLDERDLRQPFLLLYALHHALRLFAPAAGAMRLFFSHAKRDGVPLTTAARDWMKRLKGFESFYDTENLDLSGDIDAQLSQAVAASMIIVFRSDVFDQRYWCQKEVLWAEEHFRPVITVDARWQIEHAPSMISFDSTPVVRIPDGSVVRIFTAALLEALRVELMTARVTSYALSLTLPGVCAIPRCPSVLSLYAACQALAKISGTATPYIVYPNPSLPDSMVIAMNELAAARVPGCRVVSLDEFHLLAAV
jgi:hypothetical protein